MPRPRARSIAPLVGRTTLRSRAVEPEEQTVPSTHGGGGVGPVSYSVRICGHCRASAEPNGKGGMRCPSCGRTRGWL